MMTGWVVAIAVVVVAAVTMLYFRDHGSRADRPPTRSPGDAGRAPTIAEAREAARLKHMSAEDRDWEAASLQRQRARDAARDPATEALRSEQTAREPRLCGSKDLDARRPQRAATGRRTCSPALPGVPMGNVL